MAFPLCFGWFGNKAKKGAFKPAVMDKIEQFNFRPYLVDHGFLKFSFFHAERGSSPFLGPIELLLTTAAQSIVVCDNLFGPSREKYSPHRVKRQFGIDQDVPSHLSFGGLIGDCIASFTQIVVTSGEDKLSGSLGKKGSAGFATLAFLGFWKQQRRTFVSFIKIGGTRLCPSSNNGNKRLLRSKSIMGIMSKLNLPYLEVYSDGSQRLVGHLKGVKGGRNSCATKGKAGLSENGGKGKNRKVRRFKPKVAKDRAPPPTVKCVNRVKLIPLLKSANGKGRKRKVALVSRSSGIAKKKVVPDASSIPFRRSPCVAVMTPSKSKPPADEDFDDNQVDSSEESEGSPLSDDFSMHEDNASGISEDETSDGDNRAESFEGEDSEYDEDQSNSTATPIEGSDSHNTAVSMEDCEHGDRGGSGTDAQEREPAINIGVYEDNHDEQACRVVETCQDHVVDIQDGLVLLKAGESVCGDN